MHPSCASRKRAAAIDEDEATAETLPTTNNNNNNICARCKSKDTVNPWFVNEFGIPLCLACGQQTRLEIDAACESACASYGHTWCSWDTHHTASYTSYAYRYCERCGQREIKVLSFA